MTKKEFLKHCSYHKYTGGAKENNTNALFFEWKSNDEGTGYKYCVYARATNSTKKDLVNTLYDYYRGRILETDWWIQLVIALTDQQRFKVPIMGTGLTKLVKYKLV